VCLRASTFVWVAVLLVGGPLGDVSAAGEAGPAGPAPWFVVVEGDRLTVQLDRVPLPLVLAEVARQAGLYVSGGEAAGDVLVSETFRDLPLAEGIQRLLGAQSHVLVSARAPAAPGAPARWRISEIVVLSRAQAPAAGQPAAASQAPPRAVPDPQVRIQALEAWMEQRQGDSVDPLTYALVDPDEHVRARAQALWERVLEGQGPGPPPAPPPGAGEARGRGMREGR
jgi:hypothetical protein